MSDMRCWKCGRSVGVYADEIGNRRLAHVIPIALHRAVLPEEHPMARPLNFWERVFPRGGAS